MKQSPLSAIRLSLAGLRRRRAATRIAGGLLIVLLTALVLLGLLFGLDFFFHFSRIERTGLLAASLALCVWCSVRWLRPALLSCESELQLALWIERDHPALRGALASALQFDSVEPGTWGSSSLEQAVVDEVARLDRVPPLVNPYASRCARLAIGSLLAVTATGWVIQTFPEECLIFANRFLLGIGTYPTKTIISRMAINGIQVLPAPEPRAPARIAIGETLEVIVECDGALPERGTVSLQTDHQEGALVLVPVSNDVSNRTSRRYSASGNRILSDVLLQVRMGDALTETLKIEAVALPAIAIEISAAQPEYVGEHETIQRLGSPPQISVPAGSRIEVAVQCRNKKLQAAALRVGTATFPLEQRSTDGSDWVLAAGETPFATVVAPLEYELSVVDCDGLTLREPIRGLIGVLHDEAPRVVLSVATLHVLPFAEPTFQWIATDDHGVESADLQWQITGPAGSREGVVPLYHREARAVRDASTRGTGRLSLSSLKAAVGDAIRLTAVAIDDRGALAGKQGESESVNLLVTDEAGILSALAEGDHKAAAQLDELIERQLQSGAGQ